MIKGTEKLYESGDVEGGSYMVSMEPAEKISQLTHKVIYDLMAKAADDVIGMVSAKPTSSSYSP